MTTNWQNPRAYWKMALIVLVLILLCLGVYASAQYLQIRAQLQYVDLTTTPPRPADKRILLTSTNSTELLAGIDNCDKLGTLSEDPPDRTIKYRNADLGLEFDVPFNPKWGSEKYKLNPYDEYKDKYSASPYPFNVNIRFGHVECYVVKSIDTFVSMPRAYGLSVEPAKSEEDIIQSDRGIIVKKIIGSVTVLLMKCSGNNFCDEEVIVLSKKYNYIISSIDSRGDAEETYQRFLPILKTMKLTLDNQESSSKNNTNEIISQTYTCGELVTLNQDPPDRFIKYRNADLGLEFDVPFNPSWSNEKYKLKPYDEDKKYPLGALRFGPLICTNEGIIRSYFLIVEPKISKQDIIRLNAPDLVRYTEEKEVENLRVLIIEDCLEERYCEKRVTVLGKKFNYSLKETRADTEGIYQQFLPVLETFKLVE